MKKKNKTRKRKKSKKGLKKRKSKKPIKEEIIDEIVEITDDGKENIETSVTVVENGKVIS